MKKNRKGQAIIFLLAIMVILVFAVLWNFDIHKILYVKFLSQNAGDASATIAARWQAITLNIIGDLNIMKALAIAAGNSNIINDISDIQARLLYVGPMIAFMSAQLAAKNNNIFVNEDFTALLKKHASKVRYDYTRIIGPNGEMLFPEPYPGAWKDYADMLDYIANEGVAVAPDNVKYYGDRTDGHYLLMIEFYQAIAGKIWCWFYHHAYNLLKNYRSYLDWPPLPPIPHREYINSEIFGLNLKKQIINILNFIDTDLVYKMASERSIDYNNRLTNISEIVSVWYAYDSSWGDWKAMSLKGEWPMPLTGPVKNEYYYAGADAVTRIEELLERLTPGTGGSVVTNRIIWTAAAKPFGYLEGPLKPTAFTIVLPSFHDSRLIPLDASSAPIGGGYDIEWRIHIEEHLPEYLKRGPLPNNCWYCAQLRIWENPAFRQEGIEWLEKYSWKCIAVDHGGGGHRGGGTRRGH